MSKLTEKAAKALDPRKHLELTAADCADLASIYSMIMGDHKDLIALSIEWKIPIADAYYRCKQARTMLLAKAEKLHKADETHKSATY